MQLTSLSAANCRFPLLLRSLHLAFAPFRLVRAVRWRRCFNPTAPRRASRQPPLPLSASQPRADRLAAVTEDAASRLRPNPLPTVPRRISERPRTRHRYRATAPLLRLVRHTPASHPISWLRPMAHSRRSVRLPARTVQTWRTTCRSTCRCRPATVTSRLLPRLSRERSQTHRGGGAWPRVGASVIFEEGMWLRERCLFGVERVRRNLSFVKSSFWS